MNILRLIFGLLVASYAAVGCAFAQGFGTVRSDGFLRSTQLRHMSFDGLNSNIVRSAAQQGFELSNGAPVDLQRWYSPDFPNLSASFQTQISRDFALIWGGSLGESGEKYTLGPSGIVGFSYARKLGKKSKISVDLVNYFGGALRERACSGDYGAFGGVQSVNCRLAASVLAPSTTLNYLWNTEPSFASVVRVTYTLRF
jgi:hypothetical protein